VLNSLTRSPLASAALPLLALLALSLHPESATAQTALSAPIDRTLTALQPEMVSLRRDLHRHPERSGEEVRTADMIARRLRALGLETRTKVGGHGVVGVLRGARPGPVIAYRADMDAVMTNDADPVDFRSVVTGVRHSCGHDLHVTIGLALATAFARNRSELNGTVLFLFQPAEETATGAQAMLDAGALRTPMPVAIYALHTAPYPVGQLATIDGDMMSGHDRFEITVRGAGDLTATTAMVARTLAALATVPAGAMLTPGARDMALLLGPERVDSAGIVRFAGTFVTTSLRRSRVQQAVLALRDSAPVGVVISSRYQPKAIPGVFNNTALTARAQAAAARVVGAPSMLAQSQIIPAFSEDFGHFQERVPGVFFFLGVSNPVTGTVGMPHTPNYVADEGALLVGARAMAAVLLDRLVQR
jgi:metal-dependent amidase/aminoacylase/carboxypeptidase family protein